MLPFYHSGMGRVLPRGGRVPRVGRRVSVVVGRPIELTDLAARCVAKGEDKKCVWQEVTERIAVALRELEAQVPPNEDQSRMKRRRGKEESKAGGEGALPNGAL